MKKFLREFKDFAFIALFHLFHQPCGQSTFAQVDTEFPAFPLLLAGGAGNTGRRRDRWRRVQFYYYFAD